MLLTDSKIPNLAIMKLSAYHKRLGDDVSLNDVGSADKVYVSCIFPENAPQLLEKAKRFNCNVEAGGYGISDVKLPREIEHIMPDYSLYDIDYSLGVTSRGCFRQCPFCIVPKMEGPIRDHAPIGEFLNPTHSKLFLLDNNLLASPNWRRNIEYVRDRKLKVCLNAGLDIRLVNDFNAELLSQVDYRDSHFKKKRLYFAFDFTEIEPQVRRGIEVLENHGIKPKHLMFYVLVGFNTSPEQDMRRVDILKEYGCLPWIMRYSRSPKINQFYRWVNRRYYKIFPFSEYTRKKVMAEAV